jgi:hypothetical protein
VKPRRTAPALDPAALVLAVGVVAAGLAAAPPTSAAAGPASTYLGRPIYSDPTNGLQMPPTCLVEPDWRARMSGAEMEVWVLTCDSVARAWLMTRQIVEMLGGRGARLRFQVVDERILPEETAGDSLTVQCTSADDDYPRVVRGAHWRAAGRELRLGGAQGALKVDLARRQLVDTGLAGIDCVRFPDRETMMRKLQQPERPTR